MTKESYLHQLSVIAPFVFRNSAAAIGGSPVWWQIISARRLSLPLSLSLLLFPAFYCFNTLLIVRQSCVSNLRAHVFFFSSLSLFSYQSAAAAPSPVMGNMPPNDGMPGGPMPPGFFQVRDTTFSPASSLARPYVTRHIHPPLPSPSAIAKPILLSPPPFLASLAVLIPVQMCSLLCLPASVPYVHAPLVNSSRPAMPRS